MPEVWYIRHGESAANAGLSTQNPGEIPLTAPGQEQARKTSLAFERAPDLIVVSKYMRAIHTAQYTQKCFPDVPVETWDTHEFTYLSPLALGNTTMSERWPIAQAYWERCDPAYIHGEGAESFEQFMARVQAMQDKIRAQKADFIAVFGHGFVMKAMLWANLIGAFDVTRESMHNFYTFQRSFELPNCAILKAEYRSTGACISGIITDHLRAS